MNCQDAIDIMGEALTGDLSPALRSGFGEHMDECASCRTYFDQLRITRRAVRALPPENRPAGRIGELVRRFREEFDPNTRA